MRRIFFILTCISLILVVFSCQQPKKSKSEIMADDTQQISYAIGLDIGNNLKSLGFEIDVATLMQGIQDTLMGGEVLLSKEDVRDAREKLQKKMREEREAKTLEQYQENKEKGEKFLEENKSKEGVQVTESGLQYKVIKEGKGAKPKETDKVSVNYRGTLVDGTEFDSSYKRNKPTEFAVNRVIKGWTEGLQLMSVGSKYEFYIPQELAYGARKSGPQIEPYSALIFEVELLDIVTKK